MPEKLRSLITGGAGFIGSHLAEKLLAEGHHVTLLDNLSTGRYSNVEHLEHHNDVELIIDSVLNERLAEELIRRSDRVYHLASAVGVKLIMEQPVSIIEAIFGATDIVLRHCSRYRKRVLITSSSEVYGKGVSVPFREDDDVQTGATSKHRWAYGCSKQLEEFLALAHWRETRLPVVIVRLFNTVGPRQTGQYGMVVPRFVQSAMVGDPLIVHGDGEQTRCFAHVADVVNALSKALDKPDCFGQVINLGNDQEITINQLANAAVDLTASKSQIRHIPYDEAYGEGFEDMRRRVPSLEKARRLLGYAPTRDLRAIVADVAAELKGAHAVKILALIADRVQPAVTGTRVRNFHLWPAVVRLGHEVRILGLDLQRDAEDAAAGPREVAAEFTRPRRAGFIPRAIGAATRSHHQWPAAPEFADAVDRAIGNWQPQIVHAEELRMAAFLPRTRGKPCPARQTLTLHNVESDLMRKTGSTRVPFAPKLFAAIQQASLNRFEDRAVHSADLVLAYSQTDLQRYRELYPHANWGATRGGADVAGVTPVDPPSEPRVLLVGSLGYAPNVRGMEWFIERVLPKLPATIGVTVAGSGASEELKRRLSATRMRFVDTPPDLAPLYASHGLSAIPLLEGSGTRGRILEALAYQRMVVTTTKGAEGLDIGDSSGLVIEDDPARFAEAIVKRASPSEQSTALAIRGREIVMARYDWSVVAGELARSFDSCTSR